MPRIAGVSAPIQQLVRVKTAAVVFEDEIDLVVSLAQFQPEFGRAGVAQHICEPFLRRPVNGKPYGVRQYQIPLGGDQV